MCNVSTENQGVSNIITIKYGLKSEKWESKEMETSHMITILVGASVLGMEEHWKIWLLAKSSYKTSVLLGRWLQIKRNHCLYIHM
jgi:hypothetical protein